MPDTILFAPSPLVKIFPLLIAGMLVNPKTGRVEYQAYGDVYYVVIIDAGASGSRVHAYKFFISEGGHDEDIMEKIYLEDELFVTTNPGLMSFVDNPKKGAETIVELVKKADEFIPENKRAVTPLVVRATTGVRALPDNLTNLLIDHIYKAVSKLGYKLNYNHIGILKESDEAIYTWYAINLLTNNLGKSSTMALLQLGGSSAEVIFELKPYEIDKFSFKDVYVRPAVVEISLFSHSFFGQGIGAARYGIIQLEDSGNGSAKYKSVCFDPSVKNHKANIFGQHIEISGIFQEDLTPMKMFTRCLDVVQPLVSATVSNVSIKGIKRDIAATGYYYVMANQEGLISPDENGVITIEKLKQHALSSKGGCGALDKNKPWRCFDAVYIVSLLRDGYGIDENSNIYLCNDIDGYGVDWPLGLAYNYVMASIAAKPGPAHIYTNYVKSLLYSPTNILRIPSHNVSQKKI